MNILILANCLVWSLRDIFKSTLPTAKLTTIQCFNLDDANNIQHTLNQIEEGVFDVIVTNLIKDSKNPYNTKTIKNIATHSQVVSFPSVRYHGENPYSFVKYCDGYIPPQVYHDRRILSAWYENKFNGLSYDIDLLNLTHINSMAELRGREPECDISISTIIENNSDFKLFTAYHHPTNYMICKVVESILMLLNIKTATIPKECFVGEFSGSDVTFNRHDNEQSRYLCAASKQFNLTLEQLSELWFRYYDSLKMSKSEILVYHGEVV